MKNKLQLLYISNIYKESSIYFSQVLELAKVYNKNFDLKTICLSDRNRTNIDISSLVIKKYPYSYIYAVSLIHYHIFIKRIVKSLHDFTPKLIIGRGLEGALLGYFIKKNHFQDAFLILDIRGDSLDEIKLKKGLSRIPISKMIKYSLKKTITKSDHVFVVSSYLRTKLSQSFSIPTELISVFPTIVPEDKFSFSIDTRHNFREKLGILEDQILLLYSGSLAPWQNFDFILNAFEKSTNDKLKFLILTREQKLANQKIRGLSREDDITILSVEYKHVSNYLQAADYGFLIRDNIDTNLSASPTKFGEYINSGMCVILNKIKSDYVNQAMSEDLNTIIIQSKDDLIETLNTLKKRTSDDFRNINKINVATSVVNSHLHIFEHLIKLGEEEA